MSRKRRISLLSSLLLALPLVGIPVWLVRGAVSRSFGPDLNSPSSHEKSAIPPAPETGWNATDMTPGPTTPSTGLAGAGVPAGTPPAPPVQDRNPAPSPLLPGLPDPEGDFSPDNLFERVDGAADFLIAAGCRRLLFWRVPDAGAELELLIFAKASGAAKAFGKDAGSERTPGPGDEASAGDQSVFFRRGRFYVRIVGDPESGPGKARLLDFAERVDRAIQASPLMRESEGTP